MAANINENRMFCVGKCWHDEGVRVETEQTAQNAIKLARLDYEVVKVPLVGYIEDDVIPCDYQGILNKSNNKILGIVKDKYKIIQNTEAFDFFDSVVQAGEAFYHSAGSLGDGERIWILAKLPKDILLFNDDKIEQYLLLTNSHDGKHSLLMYFTPIRVVCNNTLIASYPNAVDGISIKHFGDLKNKVKIARETLSLALSFYGGFEDNCKQMLDTSLSDSQAEKYFSELLGIKEEKETSTHAKNSLNRLTSLFHYGKGNNQVQNTVWAGYNAVTEYTDHFKTVRADKIKSLLFGSGAILKRKAFVKAMDLVTV